MVANIKTIQDVTIGDTITDATNAAAETLPGYRRRKQMVFCDFYPGQNDGVHAVCGSAGEAAAERRRLTFEPETAMRWGSVSAADFWACCTWRSCRSGWSGSSRSR